LLILLGLLKRVEPLAAGLTTRSLARSSDLRFLGRSGRREGGGPGGFPAGI
jgi:hypothetical protein